MSALEVTMMKRIGELNMEINLLKAELTECKAEVARLKAEAERLKFGCLVNPNKVAQYLPRPPAAKEGKPSA